MTISTYVSVDAGVRIPGKIIVLLMKCLPSARVHAYVAAKTRDRGLGCVYRFRKLAFGDQQVVTVISL